MSPKIVSLEHVHPPFQYTQKQVFDALGYSKHYWRIFECSQIIKRHFSVRLEELTKLSFQEQRTLS